MIKVITLCTVSLVCGEEPGEVLRVWHTSTGQRIHSWCV